ncbi:MAG: AAA family ATPase [Thermoplasmata archaeon]|nr:AAA family ATPase [Thermoplasmata archaeon]
MAGRTGRTAPVVALEGPSGAGKTAVTAQLAGLLGGTVMPEAFDRLNRSLSLNFHGREELADLERNLLQEEGRRWGEAGQLRAGGRTVVLDTATFGPLTYAWGLRDGVDQGLDVLLELVRSARRMLKAGRWGLPDLTVYLDVPDAIARLRAKRDPLGHPPEIADRHAAVGRWERLLYDREFPRRLPGRFLSVGGEGTAREVALSVQERLERFGPLPPASVGECERLLGVLEASGAASASTVRFGLDPARDRPNYDRGERTAVRPAADPKL